MPVHIRDGMARIAGPYWSGNAAIVPVGHDHLVIMGDGTGREMTDATLVHAAAQAVAATRRGIRRSQPDDRSKGGRPGPPRRRGEA